MSPPPPFILLIILLLSLISSQPLAKKQAAGGAPQQDLVRSSCAHASYPNECLRTLSTYAGPANTPRDLAQAAVKVSLSRATRVSDYLLSLRGDSGSGSGSKRERGAVSDCVDQIGESVSQLRNTLAELKHLRAGTFRWQMSNAETWVSAALTYEDTCLEGFKDIDGEVRSDVRRRITNVAKVTSNALYLINRFDQSRG